MHDLGFLEFISHVLNLDLAWLLNLVLANLHYLFMFALLMYVFLDGKRLVYGFVLVILYVFAFTDFLGILGMVFFSANLLMLYYIGKLSVLKAAEETPALKKNLIVINEAQGWITFLLFNIGFFTFLGLAV